MKSTLVRLASLSRKALCRAEDVRRFLELVRDGISPEGDSRVVAGNLVHQPRTPKDCEQGAGRSATDAISPVLPHDEELRHQIRIAFPHHRQAGPLPLDAEEEWM